MHLLRSKKTLVLLGLLALVITLGGLLGTEFALRWSAVQAERLSGGTLTLGEVSGSLYGTVRIGAITFEDESYRLEAKQAELEWSPLSLFRKHVSLQRLAIQELRITDLKPDAEATPMPESLRLPLTFAASDVAVAHLVYKSGDTALSLNGLKFALDYAAEHYKLKLHGLASEWGSTQGELTLADVRPYSTQAHLVFQHSQQVLQQSNQTPDYRAEADISGDLAQLMLDVRAQLLGGQAALHARLTPFEANPLAEARLSAEGMNPALIRKDLPTANLSAQINLKTQGADGLQGDISLKNALPGRWDHSADESRVPLSKLAMQFDGTLKLLNFHDIRLEMGEAGQFKGDGQLDGQLLKLDLATRDFNPQGVHSKMRTMRLAGDIRLAAGPDSQQLAADLSYQRFRLHLDARHLDTGHMGDTVELREASIRSAASMLNAQGTLSLDGQQEFALTGALRKFNPADFGDFPAASVNAQLSADGHLSPEPQATLGFTLADSRYLGQPLSGQGRLSVELQRIWDSDIKLKLAGNHLEAKGALGKPGDKLDFKIAADQLDQLVPELGGKLHAKGVLEGKLAAPSGSFDAQLEHLSWGEGYRIGSMRVEGSLGQGKDGALAVDAGLQSLSTPQLKIAQASLKVQGTRADHTLAMLAKGTNLDVEGEFVGGWQEASGWSGQMTKLVNRGHHRLTLESPAKLKVAADRLVLEEARFDFVGAKLVLHELDSHAGQISSRGAFTGLPYAYLQGLSEQNLELDSDLTLAGDWQFVVSRAVNGHLTIQREQGDVTVSDDPHIRLGLSRLLFEVTAQNNRLQATLEATGTTLGKLKADAQSRLSLHDGSWGVAADAPLQGNLDLSVGVLSWLQPLLDPSGALTFDGALQAQIRADGTFAKPGLTGKIAADRLAVALPEQGLHLKDGRIRADLQGQVLTLNECVMRGGAGNLSGNGELDYGGKSPVMQLAFKADKLEVLSRPDRLLTLSGSANASLDGKKLSLLAKLKADKGVILLPEGDAPSASDDVVIMGQTEQVKKKASPYSISAILDMDLGDNFNVKGQGLSAQLAGALRLTSTNGALPSASGNIRVVKGVYMAYGQRLEIVRGILNFQGPLDDPGLNILAMRKNQQVEAGVAVTGTAQSPHVRLTSDPAVPDSEKLSWLVLGHGIEDASNTEFTALQAAAGMLLEAGDSVTLQQKIAHSAGLEEVSLKGTGGLETTVLTLGKRLSSRGYLIYEQGMAGTSSLVKVNYTLSKRLSVKAQAGNTPTVDLFYTFSFD